MASLSSSVRCARNAQRAKASASHLRLNVHFHSLFFDGVFVRDEDGALEFHELDEPSPEQVANVAERTARRVVKLLQKAGRSLDSEFQDDDTCDFVSRHPALASLYAAAARGVDLSGDRAGQPTARLIEQDSVKKKEPHAVVGGINLHAALAFDARDKPRMRRYLARPPIAQQRRTRRSDGSIQYCCGRSGSERHCQARSRATSARLPGTTSLVDTTGGPAATPCWTASD